MSTTLILGSSVGVVIGAIHAWSLFRKSAGRSSSRVASGGLRERARGAYYGLWALLLWTAFGSYITYLWLFAAVLYGCRQTARRLATRPSP